MGVGLLFACRVIKDRSKAGEMSYQYFKGIPSRNLP